MVTDAVPIDAALFADSLEALRGGRCSACHAHMFPLSARCPECASPDVEPIALATTGSVWTFTVLHAAPPGFAGDVPYALGVVALDDQPLRITSIITAEDLSDLAIGDTVRFELIDVGAGEESALTFAYRRVGGPRR